MDGLTDPDLIERMLVRQRHFSQQHITHNEETISTFNGSLWHFGFLVNTTLERIGLTRQYARCLQL